MSHTNPKLKTFNQVLKKASKSPVFRKEYKKELKRLKAKRVKKVKSTHFPKKGLIIFQLGEITISGKGHIQAMKNTKDQVVFIGTLIKDYK